MTDPMGDSEQIDTQPTIQPTAEQTQEIALLMVDLAATAVTTRQRARNALLAIGEPALPTMLVNLANAKFLVRWEIAKALIEMCQPHSISGLIKALEDEEQDVRWLAAVALAGIGRETLVPLLNTLINQPLSIYLRQGAHHIFTIYTEKELRKQVVLLRDALGPMENDAGVIAAAENVLHALRS